jgi:hypothetical protein
LTRSGGLQHIKGFTQLQWLSLNHTKVTDAGLEHLKGLTQLRILLLMGAHVTVDGRVNFQQAMPNCDITQ